jgi:hypothetical protein
MVQPGPTGGRARVGRRERVNAHGSSASSLAAARWSSRRWAADEPDRPHRHREPDRDGQHAGDQQVGDHGHGRLAGEDLEPGRGRPRLDHQRRGATPALEHLSDAVLDPRQADQRTQRSHHHPRRTTRGRERQHGAKRASEDSRSPSSPRASPRGGPTKQHALTREPQVGSSDPHAREAARRTVLAHGRRSRCVAPRQRTWFRWEPDQAPTDERYRSAAAGHQLACCDSM